MDSHHKGLVMQKIFSCYDVIMQWGMQMVIQVWLWSVTGPPLLHTVPNGCFPEQRTSCSYLCNSTHFCHCICVLVKCFFDNLCKYDRWSWFIDQFKHKVRLMLDHHSTKHSNGCKIRHAFFKFYLANKHFEKVPTTLFKLSNKIPWNITNLLLQNWKYYSKLTQYYDYWCPGSLHHQVIINIAYAE